MSDQLDRCIDDLLGFGCCTADVDMGVTTELIHRDEVVTAFNLTQIHVQILKWVERRLVC